MTTPKTQAPVQPPAAAEMAATADHIGGALTYRLGFILQAAELLADSQYVLNQLNETAAVDEALSRRLSSVCGTWSNPMRGGEDSGGRVLQGLLHVACEINGEIAAQLGELEDRLLAAAAVQPTDARP